MIDKSSTNDYTSGKQEPFLPEDARRVFRSILEYGELLISDHAYEEMEKDDLTEQDCRNVLRAGRVDPEHTRYEKGAWRYRMVTHFFAVVCMLRPQNRLLVVTAWRFKT